MNQSFAQLADDILAEVKTAKLVDLAAKRMIKEATAHPSAQTVLGQKLQKLARILRSGTDDVTISDVKEFLAEAKNAI